MNKKGFTIIETIATFLLVSTVSILLFELFVSLEQMYNKGEIQTRLIINQANFQRRVEQDLANSASVSITECGSNCLRLSLDGLEKELKIENGKLFYDNYTLKNVSGSTIGEMTHQSISKSFADGGSATIEDIYIPIKNKIVSGDYSIHIVHQII